MQKSYMDGMYWMLSLEDVYKITSDLLSRLLLIEVETGQ